MKKNERSLADSLFYKGNASYYKEATYYMPASIFYILNVWRQTGYRKIDNKQILFSPGYKQPMRDNKWFVIIKCLLHVAACGGYSGDE